MKLLRTLFRYLLGWFVNLFKKTNVKTTTLSRNLRNTSIPIYNTRTDEPEMVFEGNSHNNRRRTRGRFIQVIDMGYTSHVIYMN